MPPGRRQTIRPALLAAAALAAVLALPEAGLAKTHHARPHAKAAHAKAAPARKANRTPAKTAKAEPASTPFSLKPLSTRDARAYAAAFAAVRQGEFEAADAIAEGIDDRLLMGRLTYAKLMHPDYPASYDELADWLDKYRDQPDADRIYTLARKRRPPAAPAPALPEQAAGSDAATWSRVEALAERIEAKLPDAAPAEPAPVRDVAVPTVKVEKALQDAREAYYRGDVEKAYKLADQAGEEWIAGLAAFRLKKYDEAQARFASIATDETHDEWMRSGGAYWAARSAIAAGAPEAAPQYLTVAARTPYTFYGLIAERELGLDPAVNAEGLDPAVLPGGVRPSRTPTLATTAAGAGIAKLVRDDKRARRAVAFAQVGLKAEAGAELRSGLLGATGDNRQSWMRLGLALNAPLTSPSDLSRGSGVRFDIAQYPTPDLQPLGGFTLDRALVYALVRQESRFDAAAQSKSGAYGLMQLMPATAARVAGDDKLKADPSPLLDASINLRLGQDYVTKLLSVVNGDLLHAVAAYNAGPGVILKTVQRMGKEADSLLAIESMPGGQTREFVEKVVAGYWIYRNLLGQASPSLDAAASGRRAIKAALDLPTPGDDETRTATAPGELLASFLAPAPTQTGPGRPLF
jgi:soluble lytic murein transglycosylase-like protein